MTRSGWVCTNNRCWLGLSRIMCFVVIEAKLKTRKTPRKWRGHKTVVVGLGFQE